MRFVQISVIFFLFILPRVDATFDEAKVLLHKWYEIAITQACSIMARSRDAYIKDLMNDTKRDTYINNTAYLYKTQDHFAFLLAQIRLPYYIEEPHHRHEYMTALEVSNFGTDEMMLKVIATHADMQKIFYTAKVCPYYKQNCNLTLEGLSITEIEDDMAESRNYDELLYLWKVWREATAGIKGMFKFFYIEEPKLNNPANLSEYPHVVDTSEEKVNSSLPLWHKVEPLYLELHKYVSRRLKQYYGDKLDISDGLLPAHILGNMWAKSWYQIEPLVRPFPNVSDGNLEANLRKRYSVKDIFRMADEFFHSMGPWIPQMKEIYEGPDRMLTKPTDGREVICAPSSSSYCNGTYRVTMCAKVDLENYIDIHHELGNIQYYIQYQRQYYFMRRGASPAIHEAIGKAIGLSATSPRHLKKLQLLTDYPDTYESSINFLMKMALIKVPFLPFGLLAEKWKWDITNEKVPEDQWNSHWWEYRMKYQRIKPPIPRSDATDFDPTANYLVVGGSALMADFDAHLIEFQIYRGLCLRARDYNPDLYQYCPLHNCDFYNSNETGGRLAYMLRLGNTMRWQFVLEALARSRDISPDPLLEYFMPLYEFLKKENEKHVKEQPTHIGHLVFVTMSIFIVVIMFVAILFVRRKLRRIFRPLIFQ